MSKELWNKIVQFDFDSPLSEYGFSTRLACENYWTKQFTEQAIVEYKKFMFLAATSDVMVAPSEIVDTVWHQHLIFTQSYQAFCDLLGKQIQHIPSTHNKEDLPRFTQAKERTDHLYEHTFGAQPAVIWKHTTMFGSLNLKKSKFKLSTFIIIGILSFTSLIAPFYFLLKQVYLSIDNPYFIIGFSGVVAISFLALELYNQSRIKQIIRVADATFFIYHLQPGELIYLKTQHLSNVIHGIVNQLIDIRVIKVNADNIITLDQDQVTSSKEQFQVTSILTDLGSTSYPALLKLLVRKPIWLSTSNCMDAFKKYFNKSQKFGTLFYVNFGVLSLLLMLGVVRLITGMSGDKSVTFIAIAVLVLATLMISYLNRLTKLVCIKTLPDLYKEEILSASQIEHDWQWGYFMIGTVALSTSFIPLATYVDKSDNSGTGCGTSCGSSCGSSCSSCGGCGGD